MSVEPGQDGVPERFALPLLAGHPVPALSGDAPGMTTSTFDDLRLIRGRAPRSAPERVLGGAVDDGPADRGAPVLRLACSDLNADCSAELAGRTAEEILVQYVEHSFVCMHRTGPVDLGRLQSTISLTIA